MRITYRKELTALARQLRKTATKSEIILWQQLKRDALGYDFHRQKPIGDFIVDFYCHKLRLAIELDGVTHHEDETQERDARKHDALNALGITLLRFPDAEVYSDLENVMRAIRAYIEDFESRTEHPPNLP